MDGVIGALQHATVDGPTAAYLRQSISAATDELYVGMSVIALLMLLVLFIAPRRFPVIEST